MKALILRSADVVEQFSQKLEQRLSGRFVARSGFGTYQQQTDLRISANSERITQEYQNLQQLRSQVESVQDAVLEIGASIRTGALYDREDGGTVYGVEIGQQEWRDGVLIFRRFSRLTADRLSFYDAGGNEAAYISDTGLHVAAADLTGLTADTADLRQMTIGSYLLRCRPNGHLTLT